MTKRIARFLHFVAILATGSALAACSAAAPEPTLAIAPEVKIIAEVTQASATTTVQQIAVIPTVAGRQLPTLTAAATVASSAIADATAIDAPETTRQFIGAIIDEDYTIPATSTSRPTAILAATQVDSVPGAARRGRNDAAAN